MSFDVTAKTTNFKTNQLIKLIDKVAIDTNEETSKLTLSGLKENVPVDTGKLKENQELFDLVITPNIVARVVGTNPFEVDYDVHVFYPGIKRKYKGNDWVTPTIEQVKKSIPQIINTAEKEISNLKL